MDYMMCMNKMLIKVHKLNLNYCLTGTAKCLFDISHHTIFPERAWPNLRDR